MLKHTHHCISREDVAAAQRQLAEVRNYWWVFKDLLLNFQFVPGKRKDSILLKDTHSYRYKKVYKRRLSNKEGWSKARVKARICCQYSLTPSCNFTSAHIWVNKECILKQ